MDVITHKCPNCGGALTFDPGDQKFHCPFCLSIFTEDEVTAFEEKQKEAQMAADSSVDATATSVTEPSLEDRSAATSQCTSGTDGPFHLPQLRC